MNESKRETAEYQRAVSEFVNREVIYCVSYLISEMARIESFCDDEDLQDLLMSPPDYEEAARDKGWDLVKVDGYWYGVESEYLKDLCVTHLTREDSPEMAGWYWYFDGDSSDDFNGPHDTEQEARDDYVKETGSYLSEYDEREAWKELCEAVRIDADDYRGEVFEHWIVSNWLAGKLREHGCVTGKWMGMTIWRRETTGQAISMDGVICDIYDELHSDKE